MSDSGIGTSVPVREVGVLPLGVEERAHRREAGADRPPLGAAARPGDIDVHRPFDAAVAARGEARQVDPRHEQPTGGVPCGIARGRVESRRVGCVQTPVAALGDGVAPVGGDARRAGGGAAVLAGVDRDDRGDRGVGGRTVEGVGCAGDRAFAVAAGRTEERSAAARGGRLDGEDEAVDGPLLGADSAGVVVARLQVELDDDLSREDVREGHGGRWDDAVVVSTRRQIGRAQEVGADRGRAVPQSEAAVEPTGCVPAVVVDMDRGADRDVGGVAAQ